MVMPGPQTVFAANKADKATVTQEVADQPAAYCAARGLHAPVPVSTAKPDVAAPEELFVRVVEAASTPCVDNRNG